MPKLINFMADDKTGEALRYASEQTVTKMSAMLRDFVPSKDATDALVLKGAFDRGLPETIWTIIRQQCERELREAAVFPAALEVTSDDLIFRLYVCYRRARAGERGYKLDVGTDSDGKSWRLPCGPEHTDFKGFKSIKIDPADWWKPKHQREVEV